MRTLQNITCKYLLVFFFLFPFRGISLTFPYEYVSNLFPSQIFSLLTVASVSLSSCLISSPSLNLVCLVVTFSVFVLSSSVFRYSQRT